MIINVKIESFDVLFDVEVSPTDTIWSLKVNLFAAQSVLEKRIAPDNQELHHKGVCLNEAERTLESYDVQEGSQICCKLKTYVGEGEFHGLVEVFRKDVRNELNVTRFTQFFGVNPVTSHLHEITSIQLKGDMFSKRAKDRDHKGVISMLQTSLSMRKLTMRWCIHIEEEDWIEVAEKLEKKSILKELNVFYCAIGPKVPNRIGVMLETNISLMKLTMMHNDIRDAGAIGIVHRLEMNSTLKELTLSSCAIGSLGAKGIGTMLMKNKSLKKIDLSKNTVIRDEGISYIVEGLRMNSTLEVLVLSECGVGSEGARMLGEILELETISLIELDLGDNSDFRDAGIVNIVRGLELNTSLKGINLSGCRMGLKGRKRIGEMLEKNSSLVRLDLNWNGSFFDEGASRIAEGLEKNTTLMILNFDDWRILEDAKKRIEHLLKRNRLHSE